MDNSNEQYTELYRGSEIMVLGLERILKENNILYISRNDINSAMTAGFGTSIASSVVVKVQEHDLTKAKELLKDYLK